MCTAVINNQKDLIGKFDIYNFIEIVLKHTYSTVVIIMLS